MLTLFSDRKYDHDLRQNAMSKQEQTAISKICTNCGQLKPLSAFLEMSDNQGTVYGTVCSSCRKTALEAAEQRKKTDAEGSTTSESGKRIDTKSKVHDAIDKREQAERTEKEYYAERESDEMLSEEVSDSKKQTELAQKKHRETFLKKRTFLSEPRTTPASSQAQPSSKENQVANNNQVIAQETHQTKEETLKTGFDYSVGQQQGATTRFSGDSFLRFRQQVMGFAPVAKNANQTTSDKNQNKADPAEYIKDNWRPGTKR